MLMYTLYIFSIIVNLYNIMLLICFFELFMSFASDY